MTGKIDNGTSKEQAEETALEGALQNLPHFCPYIKSTLSPISLGMNILLKSLNPQLGEA